MEEKGKTSKSGDYGKADRQEMLEELKKKQQENKNNKG
jgi:hypothetical protein